MEPFRHHVFIQSLLANSSGEHIFGSAPAAHVDTQAFDFLIQGGERNQEAFGSLGLVPTRTLQHVDNDAAFDFIDDLEERRIGIVSGGARTRLAGMSFAAKSSKRRNSSAVIRSVEKTCSRWCSNNNSRSDCGW
jgi:hypothetical protein